jgi:hypothetical protein
MFFSKITKNFLITFFLIILLTLVGLFGYGFFEFKNSQKLISDLGGAQTLENSETVFLQPKVLGEETQALTSINDSFSKSENFRIKQISFGGSFPAGAGEYNNNLEISDVRSEMLLAKNEQEYKFLVTWKTSKMANSEISFSKAGGTEKSIKENGYGVVHSALLSGLDNSSPYTYSINVKDKWGNYVESDRFGMYTSQKSLSVFEMISREFSAVFGWAIKK